MTFKQLKDHMIESMKISGVVFYSVNEKLEVIQRWEPSDLLSDVKLDAIICAYEFEKPVKLPSLI